MPPKALVTDDCHPLLLEGLTQMGWMVDFEPNITQEQTAKAIADYQGLVVNSKILADKPFFDLAHNLQWIARLGSGMEIIDQQAAKDKGICVISSPEGNCDAVAEHALGMLLALANHLITADTEVRQKIWMREKNRGFELGGKTLSVIGCGHTGSALVRRLEGWGMRVLAYDKYKPKGFASAWPWVEESDMATVFEQTDILSLHLPLAEETRHWVDTGFLHKFHKNITLINTSRGSVVKTADLIEALDTGRVTGACLDVFENEKVGSFTPNEHLLYENLYSRPNIILSPHIAGWTHESKKKLAEILLQRIKGIYKE